MFYKTISKQASKGARFFTSHFLSLASIIIHYTISLFVLLLLFVCCCFFVYFVFGRGGPITLWRGDIKDKSSSIWKPWHIQLYLVVKSSLLLNSTTSWFVINWSWHNKFICPHVDQTLLLRQRLYKHPLHSQSCGFFL